MIPNSLFGQTPYKGKYIFNGIDGEGEFTYKLGANNRAILDGEFEFESKRIDSLDKRKLYKLNVTGNYSDNKKTGQWNYIDENHLIYLNDVMEFVPDISLESTRKEIKANYKEGVPHGSLEFKENVFIDENLRIQARSYNLSFFEGNLQGEFRFEKLHQGNILKIKGDATEKGVMTGNWEFEYLENGILIKETRRYEDGFLIGLNKIEKDSGTTIQEVIYYNTINKLKAIDEEEDVPYRISDNYFELTFNDGFRNLSNEFSGQTNGNQLLGEFLLKILTYDTLYVNAQNELIAYPLHTKRFRYDLSDEDKSNIDSLEREFNKLENDVTVLASRNALAINRNRKDSLAFAYEFFQFNQEKIMDFRDVVDIFSSDDIYYIDQSNFFREGFDFLTSKDVIRYEFEEKTYEKVIEYNSLDNNSKKLIELFRVYINEIQQKVNEVGGYVLGELNQIKQSEDLETIEDEILQAKNQLDSLYSNFESESISVNSVAFQIRQNILNNQFNDLNEEYSSLENYEERFKKGLEIMVLLETTETVFQSLPKLSVAWEGIVELYTDVTLDPFTFNPSFKVLRKRRIVEAGEKVFYSYLEDIKNESSYNNLKDHFLDIDNLLFRMEELREGNTSRLERRLGSETDISQIKKMLGI
ncbi:hypothetical protein [Aquiflexum lacus]|uniref:hypothetical protein n=1 Tax=Aquiflexum lacus TaxID=2483805 RepID=UPI001E42C631|nr:hypothetical protein [Aquiflexum lacus]